VENGQWAFAPDMPQPIRRKEQRRLVVNWSIKETQAEIAPGVIYENYWGFEGRVPGPVLRVRVGDLVELHLKNEITSKQPHNIDFHFVLGPGGGAGATNVAPGETATLEVRAMAPGFYMFHCATPDIPMHVANGMYGFVLVEPAEGLPEVEKEYLIVQSEYYTGDDKPGRQQYSPARGDAFEPTYMVFNGAVGSLMGDKAPRAHTDERIRLFVGNAGPNMISSFHVIGQVFDRVYREGDLTSPPGRNIQTTTIPAGGSAVVEFTPRVPGRFLLVDHALFRMHQGLAGSIVVNGPEQAEIFDPITAKETMNAMSDHGHGPGHPGGGESPIPAAKGTPVEVVTQAPLETQPGGPVVKVDILVGAGNMDKNPNNDWSSPLLKVKRGTTVEWVNRDSMLHNVQSTANAFVSPLLKPYDSWTYTFEKPGRYDYICGPHSWMKGTVIVQ
jgi:nitrite reductase (NO-forming)